MKAFERLRLGLRDDSVSTHKRLQNFRDRDAAVALLEVFENGEPSPAGRKPRAIQGVKKIAFAALGLKTDSRAARLKRFTI